MKPGARWTLVLVTPMMTGLYARGFCAVLDIRWTEGAQFTTVMLALVLGAITAIWAGQP